MESMKSGDLRIKLSEVMRRVKAGERFVVTQRGKPMMILVPYEDRGLLEGAADGRPAPGSKDIEAALAEAVDAHDPWAEVIERTRREPVEK